MYTVRGYSVEAVSYLLWDRNVYGWVMLHEINVRHVYFLFCELVINVLHVFLHSVLFWYDIYGWPLVFVLIKFSSANIYKIKLKYLNNINLKR